MTQSWHNLGNLRTARLYEVETSHLKRQVRRNMERFEGEDFMFELTREELLRCQIGTLNKGRGQHFKYLPFAFTEIGVAMLSGVLNSQVAIQANRKIMRAKPAEDKTRRPIGFIQPKDEDEEWQWLVIDSKTDQSPGRKSKTIL